MAVHLGRLRLPQRFLDYTFGKLRSVHAEGARLTAATRRTLQKKLNAAQERLDALLQLKLAPKNRDGALLSDDEYLMQKGAIRSEIRLLEEQLATVLRQGTTWVDDCERFFTFTQRLVARFSESTVDDKKTLLLLIGSNLTLSGGKVALGLRKPYDLLWNLPLAGTEPEFPIEPAQVAAASEKVLMLSSWQALLSAIRSYHLPGIALI